MQPNIVLYSVLMTVICVISICRGYDEHHMLHVKQKNLDYGALLSSIEDGKKPGLTRLRKNRTVRCTTDEPIRLNGSFEISSSAERDGRGLATLNSERKLNIKPDEISTSKQYKKPQKVKNPDHYIDDI